MHVASIVYVGTSPFFNPLLDNHSNNTLLEMKPCSASIFSSYYLKEKKPKTNEKQNKTTCRHMKRYYLKRISFAHILGLQWTLPLLSVSMQRKQSFAKINPIESDSFHWPRINTACFMSLPNIHIRNTHTHSAHFKDIPMRVGPPR